MPRGFRRQGGFPTRSQRRKSSWVAGVGSATAQTDVTASGTTLANAAVGILADGLTLVRTRGMLQLYLNAATAQDNGFTGAFGIGVVTTEAFQAGGAAVPQPLVNQGWNGWLYWTPIMVVAAAPLASGAAVDLDMVSVNIASQNVIIDSKAMRKVSTDETIVGSLEVVERGTATLRWSLDSRMLFKLP